MPRLLNVVRLQFVNRQTFIGIPLIILGGACLPALVVFMLIPYGGPKYAGGAAAAPLWYFAVVGAQSLTLTFPFALTLTVTRREFHIGTLLTATMTAIGLATIYCIIALIERATNGWGMNGYLSLPGLGADQLGTAFLAYFTACMLLFSIGYLGAAVAKRWGTTVLVTAIIAFVVLLSVAITLAARAGVLSSIAAWLGGMGFLGLTALALLLVAVISVTSYALVRRLTP